MRALWAGRISFGLVSIPVKMYGANRERAARLRLLCKKHLLAVHHKNVCEKGHELKKGEMIHGIKFGGKVIPIPNEDLKRITPFNEKRIDIISFVEPYQIDDVYEHKKYYLAPYGKIKEYVLFSKALGELGLVAFGKHIYRNVERYVIIKPYKNLLLMTTLYYNSEVQDLRRITPRGMGRIKDEELKLAKQIIQHMKSDFEPDIMKDEYNDSLKIYARMIASGKPVNIKRTREHPAKGGLIELLKKSLSALK